MCNTEEAEAALAALLASLDTYAPDLVASLEEAEASLAALLADLEQDTSLDDMLADLERQADLCPFCGQPRR
jgi:erythromycin esterase-like protein